MKLLEDEQNEDGRFKCRDKIKGQTVDDVVTSVVNGSEVEIQKLLRVNPNKICHEGFTVIVRMCEI